MSKYHIGRDIYLEERYIQQVATAFRTTSSSIEKKISSYIKLLENVKKEAIIEGELSDNIAVFIEQAKTLQNVTGDITNKTTKLLEYYMYAMDEADEDLYT